MTAMLQHAHTLPLTAGPGAPAFTEDLSRFPSESLHSFSFAHQSEDLIHNRQNVIKRSMEIMKGVGWSAPTDAGIASAQARVTGDIDTQNALDLLARAQLVGANNLPNPDPLMITGPLSGPADVSGENVFEKEFIPRTASPDLLPSTNVSPTTVRPAQFPNGPATAPITIKVPSSSDVVDSADSSRTPTNESGTTQKTSPPGSRRPSVLRRTQTDVQAVDMQQKLMDALAKPFVAPSAPLPDALISPTVSNQPFAASMSIPAVHGHSQRWVPAAQAIFTTEAEPPYTIIAANDLACLVFGVTIAEVRKMGILEVVQEERRSWLEKKLLRTDAGGGRASTDVRTTPPPPSAINTSSLLGSRGGGITARLLSKPNSRIQPPKAPKSSRQSNTTGRSSSLQARDRRPTKSDTKRSGSKPRGVLLCGDVIPIQKRNGATGSASIWVKEKDIGLIWVVEEINEDVATLSVDDDGFVTNVSGAVGPIWGAEDTQIRPGGDIGRLIPRIPRQGFDPRDGAIDFAQITKVKYFTCQTRDRVNIPATVEQVRGKPDLRVSSFPHIAGIIVVSPKDLTIKSSNSAFCAALFGYERPDGKPITNLIPNFANVLDVLYQQDGVLLIDGMVIPEHSFRKASAFLAVREGKPEAASAFLRPDGLPARHRDGSELKIDVQLRVVKSETHTKLHNEAVVEDSGDESASSSSSSPETVMECELVYALWITYSRHLHATNPNAGSSSPILSGAITPLHQPSPGQNRARSPEEVVSDSEEPSKELSKRSMIAKQIKEVALSAAAKLTGGTRPSESNIDTTPKSKPTTTTRTKKHIDDFTIIENMGQGAFGQVKRAEYKPTGKQIVLKYVTKRRILVDTWMRDRRLGTVPLEIHVLDYLRRQNLQHQNIVEMEDFFEDETNYYIEMKPHGPGMDLFDYIELFNNLTENECRNIFVQVAEAVHHLHTKAKIVHRDIKDENVILDAEGNIKLIDFGSAAYLKNAPWDVFVGTIGK